MLSTGTPIPAQWTCRRRRQDRADIGKPVSYIPYLANGACSPFPSATAAQFYYELTIDTTANTANFTRWVRAPRTHTNMYTCARTRAHPNAKASTCPRLQACADARSARIPVHETDAPELRES